MSTFTRVHMLTLAVSRAAASAILDELEGVPQNNPFSIPLYSVNNATAETPVAAYGCSGVYNPAKVEIIETWEQGVPIAYGQVEGDSPAFDAWALAEHGFYRFPEQEPE